MDEGRITLLSQSPCGLRARIQTQPEAIKCLRDNYEEDSLPEWVGRLEEETAPTQANAPTTVSTTEEESVAIDPEDVAEGTPVQSKAIEGVQKIVGNGVTSEVKVGVDGGAVKESGVSSGGVKGGGTGEVKGKGETKESPPPEKSKIPPQIVSGSPPPPKKAQTLKQGVTEELSPAKKELIELMQQMQYHDPDVVPMNGGGFGKLQRDKNGTIIGVVPVAERDPSISSSRLEQLVSEATIEDLNVNTLGLLRRVALNPAVTMGHTYVTSTVEDGVPLFIGDLADWINWCCEYALKTAFGVKFAIITGGPSMKDRLKELDGYN